MTKIEIRPGERWTNGVRCCRIITVANKVDTALDLLDTRVVVYSLGGTPEKSRALMLDDFLRLYRPARPYPVKYRLEFSGDCERFSQDAFDSIQEALESSFEYFAEYKSEEDDDESYLCRKDWNLDDSEITFEVYEQHDLLAGDELDLEDLIETLIDRTDVDWEGSTPFSCDHLNAEQRDYFADELRSVLNRYVGEPDHFIYRNPVRYIVQDGKPVKA